MVVDMTFSKINEYTVQCVITMSEIDQMGYALQELYTNREAASEFMRNIMKKGEEAGFQLNSNLQEIQAMLLSDSKLVLSFTAVDPDRQVNQMIENILAASDAVELIGKEHLKEILHMTGKEKFMCFQEIMAQYNDMIDQPNQDEAKTKELKEEKSNIKDKKQYMFQFANLSHLEQLCKSVKSQIPSSLYRNNEQYYLLTDFAGMDQDVVNSFIVRAMEFAARIENNKLVLAYIKEHANHMLEKEAIDVLKKL
ncbi:adaptor protein MecA [Lachnotalea glycerini]|jgi:negative regulator of genetic competence, sporulation and motility|uniref:Adaptor protein MecA n=2 Tax=Lachnotalea glycerini TaxID=1763509 RepID=A0A371JE95_9FIRM|nr:adaptor protein MecA [Lachnotalea glycerini]